MSNNNFESIDSKARWIINNEKKSKFIFKSISSKGIRDKRNDNTSLSTSTYYKANTNNKIGNNYLALYTSANK